MKVYNVELLLIDVLSILACIFFCYTENYIMLTILLILLVLLNIVHILSRITKFRYSLIPHKKTIILANIDNQSILRLYYGRKKEKEAIDKILDIIEDNTKKGTYIKKYGNRFLIITQYTNTPEIISIINKINEGVSKIFEDDFFTLTLRFGIQLCDEEDFNSNLNKAFIACSNAKREKMSYYSIYDDEDVETQLKEKKKLIELVKSLKNHEFEVFYQPKYDYKEKKIVGSEALVRLVQDGHVVPAGEFIEVAEKHGFTTYLDKYVLREVCKKINELKRDKVEFNTISVNVSRNTLCEEKMLEYYASMLDKYDIKKKDIEFEVTERSENGMVSSEDKIHELSKLFNVSIDDFGVGNSSLSMLVESKIKTIKIDRQFIIDESEKGRTILNNIIKLIKELGFEIVAEGVETEEQKEYLTKRGCNVIQGYYYSRPLTFDEYKKALESEDN